MRRLAVLGSTGSVGEQALAVAEAFPDRYVVVALAAGRNVEKLAEQVRRFEPEVVSVADAAAADLLRVPEGRITEAGLATNISVALRYLHAWLRGNGCVPIANLMEDAATAEISRSQIWQWIEHGAELEDGAVVTRDLVRQILDEEMEKIHAEVGDETWAEGDPEATREVFERVALADDYADFLTTVAYERLD